MCPSDRRVTTKVTTIFESGGNCGMKPTVRTVSIDALILDERNANKGTKRGRELLAQSLDNFGAGRSVLVDCKNRVIAGNKTIEAARAAGLRSIAVIETDGSSLVAVQRRDLDLTRDKKARELAIADNRVSEADLEWSPEVLVSLDVDLAKFWSEAELNGLLKDFRNGELSAPEPKIDQAAELQKKWQTKRCWGTSKMPENKKKTGFRGPNPDVGKAYRWKKGQSGNPSGRPKSKTLSDAYRNKLEEPVPNDPEKRTWAELIAEAQVRDAVRGNVQAAREIADRTEGKAKQAIEFEDANMARSFERMTTEELEAYARDGSVPIWFPKRERSVLNRVESLRLGSLPLGSVASRAAARALLRLRDKAASTVADVRIVIDLGEEQSAGAVSRGEDAHGNVVEFIFPAQGECLGVFEVPRGER